MNKYFVSFSHSNGTGFTTIECADNLIESIEDIEKIIECIQKENPRIKNVIIMNIQRLPI